MSIIKDSFKSFLFNILGAGCAFLFQMIAAKYLGAEVYGEANYYLGYCTTITVFINFGLQTYLPKRIPHVRDKKELFSEVVSTFTVCFFILQIVLIFFLKMNNINIFDIGLITVLAYLTSLSEIILSYNVATGNAAKGMLYRKFLYSSLNLILFLVSSLMALKEYYIYLLVMILAYGITCVPFLIKNICKFKFNYLILKYSLGFYIIQIVYGAYAAYSKVLQKEYGTFETVAVLSVSLTIGALVAMLGDNFAKVSMPEFSKAWEKRDLEKLKKIYMTVSRLNCFLVLPIAIALVVNSNRILNILGKGYVGGEIIFSLIMLSQFTNSFTGPNGTILVMTKYTQFEIFNGIIKLIVSILIILTLGNKYIAAVALSLAVAEIVVNILKCVEVYIKLGISPYKIKDLLFILVLFVFESLILFSISKVENFVIWFMLNCVAMLAIYLITFVLSPNSEDKVIIKSIRGKLKF